MRAVKEQNILKGILMQDDCISPLVIFLIMSFGPFYFFLGVPSDRLKCVSLQSHVKAAASVTHLMEALPFIFLFQRHVSNSTKINFMIYRYYLENPKPCNWACIPWSAFWEQCYFNLVVEVKANSWQCLYLHPWDRWWSYLLQSLIKFGWAARVYLYHLCFVIGTFRERGSDNHFPAVPLDVIQHWGGNDEQELFADPGAKDGRSHFLHLMNCSANLYLQ